MSASVLVRSVLLLWSLLKLKCPVVVLKFLREMIDQSDQESSPFTAHPLKPALHALEIKTRPGVSFQAVFSLRYKDLIKFERK